MEAIDKNEQAKELIRCLSAIENKQDVYKLFSGLLKYIAICNSCDDEIVLPEIGVLKLNTIKDKVYMSIYPNPEFEQYILKCKQAEDTEDYSSSPLFKILRSEFNMTLKSKF